MNKLLIAILFLNGGVAVALEAAPESDDSITIYSRMQPGAVAPEWYRPSGGRNQGGNVPGYAIIRHDRPYRIDRGTSTLRVTDVAALIDPTTVTFTSLDRPQTRVLEQSFQFDLVSQAKLLERYLGQPITVEQVRGDTVDRLTGRLLGIGDGLTLQLDDGSVAAVREYANVAFSELPGGLITRPTLEWLLDSPAAGEQEVRIAYETQGMTWWADYNIILDEANGCSMDLSAWVSIINQSGASYPASRLKLIAGDVHRAEPPRQQREVMYRVAMAEDSAGFAEKSFFEYHLYTLGRRTDLPDNSTKQIELMPTAAGVDCEKELVFAPTLQIPYRGHQQLDQQYGRQGQGEVNVFLRFANEAGNGLGRPLPAGRMRVNQLDTDDGSLEFIGEDVIDHTPRNEDVLIRMGNAFDVVGERTQTDFRVDTRTRNLWETFEIKLRNHKDEATNVVVLENLYRAANWTIEDATAEFSKENSNRIRFDVRIPSEGEAVIRYTAHYTW
ncbi:DUF4139 domain-containing protein [Elongatibacter sediminis]|uniref:DUF4139 domain-containing protein n=1 Tax=Elongatibacter sediminis TaxID=3119006 RepID=A0AAW9RLB4_9GAMM